MADPAPDPLEAALREAREEIARLCAVRISEDDPVMALLIGHEVMARHQAEFARKLLQEGAEGFARRMGEMENVLARKLREDLGKSVEASAALFQEAALRERADFIGALKTLTLRQEKAARQARASARFAFLGAALAISAPLLLGIFFFSL